MRRAVERFSWLMYEIVLKYACPVSDIIAEDFLFMRIQLSEHFTYRKLLRFTLPSVIMMVCTSIYCVVDGVFVSNFVGSDAFAAVNLIMPFLMVLGAVGFMLGTGGSALVAYTLGAGNEKRANEIFSLLIYVLIGLGAVFTIGGIAAGIGGVLASHYYGYVSPLLGGSLLIFAFIVTVIGGLGSLTGAAIASVLVAVLQQFANVYLGGTGDFIVVVLLAVVLLVRPRGLMGRKA